jgi:hemerythrin superfamily protein
MKVTVLLRNDHEALKALFDRFKTPSGARPANGKKDLFDQIQRDIQIHSQMEQEIFYPALRATPSAQAAELVSNAQEQHLEIEKLLKELNAMSGGEKAFDTKMGLLMDEVLGHIEMEEEQIFDEARKNLPEYRLEELGLEMEDRKRILSTLAA